MIPRNYICACIAVFVCCSSLLTVHASTAGKAGKATTHQSEAVPEVKRGTLKENGSKKIASEEERMEYKRDLAKELVHQAVDFFKTHSVSYACRKFAEDESWQFDEMYAFVIHGSGTIYVHGKDTDLIWRNINDAQKMRRKKGPTELQDDLVVEMRKAARSDGWLNYEWNFENKHVYVQEVYKDGRQYYIGTGFYPESHRYLVKQLVKEAINYMKTYGTAETFQRINNPYGTFTEGPLHLWVYDFEGMCWAHGEDYGMVGRDHTDWQGAQGRFLIRDIIDHLQDHEHGWFEYYGDGNVFKRAYVQRVVDPDSSKRFFVGGPYFPEIDMQMTRDFVDRAISYLQSKGPTVAFSDFTNPTSDFHKGPLHIYVYNMDGVILADGANPSFVGKNMLKIASEEGMVIAKEILRKAREFGEGTTTVLSNGEYKDLYYKKKTTPSGTYVIGSGYWPSSKRTVAESLAQKAASELSHKSIEDALHAFTTWSFDFVRGDLFVEVLDYDGIVLAYGPRKSYVWGKVDVLTETGDTVADVLIATAEAGGGWRTYRSQGREYHMYVKKVQKNVETQEGTQAKNYVVGVFYI